MMSCVSQILHCKNIHTLRMKKTGSKWYVLLWQWKQHHLNLVLKKNKNTGARTVRGGLINVCIFKLYCDSKWKLHHTVVIWNVFIHKFPLHSCAFHLLAVNGYWACLGLMRDCLDVLQLVVCSVLWLFISLLLVLQMNEDPSASPLLPVLRVLKILLVLLKCFEIPQTTPYLYLDVAAQK